MKVSLLLSPKSDATDMTDRTARRSPAAAALFAAFDAATEGDKDGKTVLSKSSFIQKRAMTAAWRNRHSQDSLYPYSSTIAVHQVQRGEVEETYGTGATVWPAAVVLCKYLQLLKISDSRIWSTVVDLGSGTGLTSIVAAPLWPEARIVCTDGNDKVVRLAKENIDRHPTTCSRIEVCTYWWDSTPPPTWFNEVVNTGPVLVLVADCVLPKLYPIGPLVEALDQLLTHHSSMALLSYEYRYFQEYDPEERFRQLCSQKGLVVKTVPLEEQDVVYQAEDIHIWMVTRQRNANGLIQVL